MITKQPYLKPIRDEAEQLLLTLANARKELDELKNLPDITPEIEQRKKDLEKQIKELENAGKKALEDTKTKSKELPEKASKAPKQEGPKTLPEALKSLDVKLGENLTAYDTLYITMAAATSVLFENEKLGEKAPYMKLMSYLMDKSNGKAYINIEGGKLETTGLLKPLEEINKDEEIVNAVKNLKATYAMKAAELILTKPGKFKTDEWKQNAKQVLEMLSKPGIENLLKEQLQGYGQSLSGVDLYLNATLRETGINVEQLPYMNEKIKKSVEGKNALSLMEVN